MGKGDVSRIAPPPGALTSWYGVADLVDSYALELPTDTPHDARLLARAMLGKPSPLVSMAMLTRDTILRRFGVKTSTEMRDQNQGRHIDHFPVLSEDSREVVLGEDDRHLDFRMALTVMDGKTGSRFVVTNVVRCHNRLGRIYLAVIRPFHERIAAGALRRLGKELLV